MKNLLNLNRVLRLTLLLSLFSLYSCTKDEIKPKPNNPTENKGNAPVISAGEDKEIRLPEHTTTLIASIQDAENDVSSILWQQIGGPGVALMNGQQQAAVTLVQLKEGIYHFALIVNDQKGNTSRDEVRVIVNPEVDNINMTRLQKIDYSANDWQSMQYDAEGRVVKYISQWQYVQNDPSKLRRIEYDIQYNQAGKIDQLNISGGLTVKYFYNQGILHKTEETNALGELRERIYYTFEQNKLKIKEKEMYLASGLTYNKYTYEYNGAGNVSKEVLFTKSGLNTQYQLALTVEYHQYDDKVNPHDFLNHIPFLPGVEFQKNNLIKREVKLPNGTTQNAENYVYQYRDNGLPKYRRKTVIMEGTMATLENRYIYQ